ncbi:MAG: VacJ family lipoprotein [Deltaproteobacteria bacterium]|jgi:phospholipid-binding lipoprotein MlaA|nr:VacJ family lipoprotein [Deltaproteobacteria bacterium]
MTKLFQLRVAALGFGFALLVGVSACATAPSAPEADVVSAGEEFSPDTADDDEGGVAAGEAFSSDIADDDYEYDDLFDDEFGFGEDALPYDPLERTNRSMLNFNQELNRYVFDPMIRGYRFAVPRSGRQAVHRVFLNMEAPTTLVNDLLQLRFKDAATTVGRFFLNSTIGFGGIFDVAIEADWEHHESDFGQTLGRYGVGPGPYLMLPLLGPSTVRDGVGSLVDIFLHPLFYVFGLTPNILIGAGSGFSSLDAHDPALKALEESSVDFYAALRSAYLQNRAALILKSRE